MKTSRFSAEQIVSILNEATKREMTVAEICRKHGITEQTYYRWRRAYGGLQVDEAKRLRALEDEIDALSRITQIHAVSDHPNSRTWGFGFGYFASWSWV